MMKRNHSLFFTVLMLLTTHVAAQNPIVQTCYTSDPAPMVHDGTFYVYTGHDEDASDYFHMNEWRVYSSRDMVNWTDHGSPLSLASFSWSKAGAWAAQCIEHKGKFYWYVCCQDKNSGTQAIGVAVSKSPTGPFKDAIGKPLATGSWDYIDPTAFVDDDGQAYLYWGNPNVYFAKLNPDMTSIDGEIKIIEQSEESFGSPSLRKRERGVKYKDFYTEGPWFTKRNGKYYLLYAAGGIPEHIAYSMSDKPEGPWRYMGTVMAQYNSGSFTNHCGIIDYKGKSYFSYHTGRLPGGSGFTRSVAIEEFSYNADGTLPLIQPTDKGVSPVGTLNPYKRVEAETIAFSRGIKSESNKKSGVYLSNIHPGDSIVVRVIDFGEQSPVSFTASVASALQGGVMDIHLDSPDGPLLCTLNVPCTGGWEAWKRVSSKVEAGGITGVHDLYFRFKGNVGSRLFNFDWWKFRK